MVSLIIKATPSFPGIPQDTLDSTLEASPAAGTGLCEHHSTAQDCPMLISLCLVPQEVQMKPFGGMGTCNKTP